MFQYRFNKAVDNVKPNATSQMQARARAMKNDGIDVIMLTGGEPDFDTPDPIRFKAIEEIVNGNTHYAPPPGLPALRRSIAEYLNTECGMKCTMDNILVTPGAKEAVFLTILALINPGEEVMFFKPTYVSYPAIISSCRGEAIGIQLDVENNYAITREILEENFSEKTRVLLVNSPTNPCGKTFTEEETQIIVDFVKEHGIILISDEIYNEIVYDGRKSISFGRFHEIKDQTVIINGFSKSVAMTGWRLGYGCFPEEIRKRVLPLIQHTYLCCSSFVQEAAVKAYECKEDIERMRKVYEERRNVFIGALNEIEGVSAAYPEGAFYAWVKFDKNNMSAEEVANYLLDEAHVAAVPGDDMGGQNHLRFSFAFSTECLEEAARRIRIAMDKL